MKLETVMNALVQAHYRMYGAYTKRSARQYRKFRDWIIRRDARMSLMLEAETARAGYWHAAYQLESNYNDRED